MSTLVRWIDQHLYRDYSDHWDDELFRRSILQTIEADWDILDLGAGAGVVRQMNFRGQVQRVCGVDPDRRVLDNAALDEAKVGRETRSPLTTNPSTWSLPTTCSSTWKILRPSFARSGGR